MSSILSIPPPGALVEPVMLKSRGCGVGSLEATADVSHKFAGAPEVGGEGWNTEGLGRKVGN